VAESGKTGASQRMITPDRFLLCLLLLTSIASGGCSKQQPVATPQGKANATNRLEDISALAESDRKELEAFAREFEMQLRQGLTNEARLAFDRAAIVSGICEGLQLPARRLDEFKLGLSRGLQSGIETVVGMWSGQEVKFKHLALYKGEPAARFRFSSDESGIALVDLVIRKHASGKARIVNFCNHAIGYEMIEQARQTAAPVLAEFDRTFLERLLQQPNLTAEHIKDFTALSKKFAARDFQGAVQTYKVLPPALHDTLAATAMNIAALQQTGDDKAYQAALREAAARFKTPNFQFMLLDAYFLDKEYDKAAACIEAFMNAIEKDAALLALKSCLLNLDGNLAGARPVLGEALALEPDCVYAHSKGLDVLLAAKDWRALTNSMVFLEGSGGYDFKDVLTDPIWDDFKKAPESARWR
jgi:hypothetical protein